MRREAPPARPTFFSIKYTTMSSDFWISGILLSRLLRRVSKLISMYLYLLCACVGVCVCVCV